MESLPKLQWMYRLHSLLFIDIKWKNVLRKALLWGLYYGFLRYSLLSKQRTYNPFNL